jgi:Ca-activated chloride channel family protein
MHVRTPLILIAVACAFATVAAQQPDPQAPSQEKFRFRSAVELINVSATVTDDSGRFVSGLGPDDFRIYEDGVEQPITHFSNERVPVSLGIVLDTSNSMEGEKIQSARTALRRFLVDLLDPSDEVFLYRFDNTPERVEGWTADRDLVQSRIGRIVPRGGTAMYDAMAEAVPYAQSGENRKKAVVLISDGNDTNSETTSAEVRSVIRDSEVMVYAIGIDAQGTPSTPTWTGPQGAPPIGRPPIALPFPFPGGRRTPTVPPRTPQGPSRTSRRIDERVNVDALRNLTDDSGGRTEIIRSPRDLDPATAGIADELSRQYSLGYPSPGKDDGRWHDIRVEVRSRSYNVRARRGYMATR